MTTPLLTRLQLQMLVRKIIHTHGTDLGAEIVFSVVQKEIFRENLLANTCREPDLLCEQSL
jgi:hypothetical protein